MLEAESSLALAAFAGFDWLCLTLVVVVFALDCFVADCDCDEHPANNRLPKINPTHILFI
ncbi:hypothetical protein LPE01_05810 [Lactiplantibacillus pentosus]|nr:hypothetical protein LPE01_05810 [Lactiplantibacillus pentosus]